MYNSKMDVIHPQRKQKDIKNQQNPITYNTDKKQEPLTHYFNVLATKQN